ncbi:calmodulin-binding transcription activator 4-like isoform X2 [Carya illinoinensis]|uniref:calmodulin-binding transcription activator 4-like isoform X2 n=1 Tax=Carya illinoinensis TaxID=32201 RepID=UPI001C7256CA|nr:calmodulin-binding transcription activator 4-like isoform X2 [Carya illinoinensis]
MKGLPTVSSRAVTSQNQGKHSPGSFALLSPGSSSSYSQSPTSYISQNPGSNSKPSDFEPYKSLSSSGSEVSSEIAIKNNGVDDLERVGRTGQKENFDELQVTQALRRLEEQLSLDEESFQDISLFYNQCENPNDSDITEYEIENSRQDEHAALPHGPEYIGLYYEPHGVQNSNRLELHNNAGESKGSSSWEVVFESFNTSSDVESQQKHLYTLDVNEKNLSLSSEVPKEEEHSDWLNFNLDNAENTSLLPHKDADSFKFPEYSSAIETHEITSDYYTTLLRQDQTGMLLEANSSLTVAEKQKFTIQEISPEWGYETEATKVVIIGSFLCDPLESTWACMFGDVEVPVQIIQEGVIRCEAPSHLPGKVTLCITSGNRESCSEVREFEYRMKTRTCTYCASTNTEANKSLEELLLLVRFVQLLLSDTLMYKRDNVESENDVLRRIKADDDSWSHVIEALLVGSGTSSDTIDWVLQELLKDKLHQWLSSRSQEGRDQTDCSLSKKEQGIIHMIAGLGFEWAVNPILSSGININFRDINGWTAVHWAAHFGREKMVAALIASGASAGAVTDPTSQDPLGKTPASIAATSGHKGLAGYLSEVALTSHLSSLTMEESELSKGSAEVEAEMTVNSISNGSLADNGDQLSLKDTLAAVRNAAQAAARIQAAFRAHSFRKRLQRESAVDMSALSNLVFRNPRKYNSAALSIQKKYRGWKGRKVFLAIRQKVVKIQAHVRGFQVRKSYKVICWAVGILDKVVLRWRRKGVGLRGFLSGIDTIDETEDEDILRVFRKKKVDLAIDDAVALVISMVESPEARWQYRRVLQRYRQAKAELGSTDSEVMESSSLGRISSMKDEVMYHFP